MKKVYLLILTASFLLAGEGCKKATEADLTHSHSLIETAKDYFDKNVITNTVDFHVLLDTIGGKTNRDPRRTSLKNAAWDKASVVRLSAGEAVVVPVHYGDPFVIKSSFGGNKLYSVDDLAKLLIYQDKAGKFHTEVVTFFPDSSYTNLDHKPFSGIVLVEDWSGKQLNKYRYSTNGSIKKYDPALAARRISSSGRQGIQVCYEISGYNYPVNDPENGYYWTESLGCDTYYFEDESMSPTEVGGADYGWLGGGGTGGSYGISVANAVTVLPGSNTITNFKDYSKCFDMGTGSGRSYQVSVCVSQPEPGSRETWTFGDGSSKGGNVFSVGHTFLILSESAPSKTIVRNVGFYPSGSVTPYSPTSQGSLNNDEMHDYNISLTINLTGSQFNSLLSYIAQVNTTGYTYNLNSNNCTTFALNALGSIGIDFPRTTGTWLNGNGNDPGDLGEDIRQMKLASNMTRSTTEVAHSNKGTCK